MNSFPLVNNLPTIDASLSITAIVAIAAILSPVITTLINNKHQLTIKKLELERQKYVETNYAIKQIYLDLLKYAGNAVVNDNKWIPAEYGEVFYKALLYAPDDLRDDLIILNNFMLNYGWNGVDQTLKQITPKIKKYLEKL